MGVPAVFVPKVTQAGKAAAIDASNAGLTLRITAMSYGTGQYDPTGFETALFNEVKRVPVSGAMRPRPNQMRVGGVWADHAAESEIGEIAFWAGNVLFAVWSRKTGGPIGYKTLGVDFVAFYDLVFDEVPAGSIEVVINTDVSEALSALLVHEVADDAHSQYLLRAAFVDAHALMTAVAVGGTANAITVRLPNETVMTELKFGQQVVFIAASTNSGPVTANVSNLGVRSIRKNGSISLAAGDIISGAVYTLFYDGVGWQLSGGVGGGQVMTRTPFVATAGQTTFNGSYVPGAIMIAKDGLLLDNDKYVANTGTSFVLNTPATAGQLVELISFRPFSVADTYTKAEADARYIAATRERELGPPGQVSYFAMETPPAGWLRCDGALVSRTTYAALFAALGTRFGAGDNSTTFRLPDLRGEFIRGWDNGRGVDAARQLGSSQASMVGPHTHSITTTDIINPTAAFIYNDGSGDTVVSSDNAPAGSGKVQIARFFTDPNTGTDTRPRNVALLGCIKF